MAAAVQVIAFNIGVELGQLVAILAIVMLGQIIWRQLSQRLTWQTVWRTVHAGLMILGLAGGAILATTTANGPNPTAHPPGSRHRAGDDHCVVATWPLSLELPRSHR